MRFAHFSVKQYLEDLRERNIIQDYPLPEQGILACGEFCVAYLSFSDFNLQIRTQRKGNVALTVPPPILLAQDRMSGFFSKRFLRRRRDQSLPVSMPLRGIRTTSVPDRTRYKFLDYAISNWALQTKQISHTSLVWERFEQLATCFNETWNFHPWIPSGRSASSRLHDLFGWAVTEQHEPFLSIAQAAGPDLHLVCNLPLVDQSLPALHIASKLGNQTIVEILLGFCKVNSPDPEGYTALHHAARAGHDEICQLLLAAKGIEINARSKDQCKPLSLAARNGHERVVKVLLEKGADVEAKGPPEYTPLFFAAWKGHGVVVKVLLEKGADIDAKNGLCGLTALSSAAENGHEEVVKLLIDKGADIEFKDVLGFTPLSWAAWGGYEAVVKMLLERGADIEAKGNVGLTALSFAAWKGHEPVLKVLLEKGADVEAKDLSEHTPLSWATASGHQAVVKLLLENGADFEHSRPLSTELVQDLNDMARYM